MKRRTKQFNERQKRKSMRYMSEALQDAEMEVYLRNSTPKALSKAVSMNTHHAQFSHHAETDVELVNQLRNFMYDGESNRGISVSKESGKTTCMKAAISTVPNLHGGMLEVSDKAAFERHCEELRNMENPEYVKKQERIREKMIKGYRKFLERYYELTQSEDVLSMLEHLDNSSDVTRRNFCLNRGLMLGAAYKGRVIYYVYNKQNSKLLHNR